ncbi:MAG: hypothetical protein GQ534_11105 [Candidatus Delongbacteria bacterium]|nr:hypothetical protein [Candidatus Delongbacteria bacterium]
MTNWKTILTFTYPHEAHPVKALLDSHDISTFLRDEMTVQAHNFYSNAVCGVKLQVPEIDFDKAKNLLIKAGFISENKIQDKEKIEKIISDESINQDICPFCKSDNISEGKHSSLFLIIIYFFMALIPMFKPMVRSFFRCYDCKKKWKYVKK